jgi:cellulose synthase/poly-beta-1,6-N-acetylglucosamine synthase-like glycosyltransferase
MIALLACLIWIYLYFFHGRFWSSEPELRPAVPMSFPDVDIIVPARDEAETIGPVIASLLAQDYAGTFRVILVDDNSVDGTAARAGAHPRLTILTGAPKPAGWTGKLWALAQGVAASAAPVILFTDADITHDPRHHAGGPAGGAARRPRLRDGTAELHLARRAAADPGLRVFFPDALPVRARE